MDQRNRKPRSEDFERYARSALRWIRNHPTSLMLIIVVLIVLFCLPTMVFIVDRDEEAVVLLFGKFARQQGPGIHYKMPYPAEKAHIVQTRKVFSEEFGYRAKNSPRNTSADVKQESLMLTGDLGVARVQWQVQYRKVDPKSFVFNVRDERTLIRETCLTAMRRIIGDFFVAKVITVAREDIRRKVKNEMQTIMDSYSAGIQIADIELQETEPPDRVESAFREVDSARQDRERFQREAEREEERVINETRGKVNQQISEAKGQAAAVVNRAKGDAERFERLIQQYEEAPEITETRMFLETMQDVMNKSKRVYIVDRNVRGLLPLLNLKKNTGK